MFKVMTGVLDQRKKPSDEEIQKIPSYIFCRWLSGSPYTIQAANIFNKYDKIPIENQYKMIKSAFAGKVKYIPYPKRENTEGAKTLEYISEHFKINLTKAEEYLELLDPAELKSIIDMYEAAELKK